VLQAKSALDSVQYTMRQTQQSTFRKLSNPYQKFSIKAHYIYLDASTGRVPLLLLLSPREKKDPFNALGLSIGLTTPTTPARSPNVVRPGVSFPSFLGVSLPLLGVSCPPPLSSRFGVSLGTLVEFAGVGFGGGVGGGADGRGIEGGGIAGGGRATLPDRLCTALALRPAIYPWPGLVPRPSFVPARLGRGACTIAIAPNAFALATARSRRPGVAGGGIGSPAIG
jgi:hypothetical protein